MAKGACLRAERTGRQALRKDFRKSTPPWKNGIRLERDKTSLAFLFAVFLFPFGNLVSEQRYLLGQVFDLVF